MTRPAPYAEGTHVAVSQSRAELERLIVQGYGGAQFRHVLIGGVEVLRFVLGGRLLEFELQIPDAGAYAYTAGGARRSAEAASAAAAAEHRRRWRALVATMKLKLDTVRSGFVDFEQEFHAYIVLPDGRTVYDTTMLAIEAAYTGGRSPLALPPPSERRAA